MKSSACAAWNFNRAICLFFTLLTRFAQTIRIPDGEPLIIGASRPTMQEIVFLLKSLLLVGRSSKFSGKTDILRRNPAQVTMASVDSGDIRHSIGCE
jgi:hypothetical protein